MKKRVTLAFIDILILIMAFLIAAWLEPGTRRVILPNHTLLFVILVLFWLPISSLFGKYKIDFKQPLNKSLFTMVTTNLSLLGICAVLVIVFKLFNISQVVLFGTIAFASILEFFLISVLSIDYRLGRQARELLQNEEQEVVEKLEKIQPTPVVEHNNIKRVKSDISDQEKAELKSFVEEEIGQEALEYISSFIDMSSNLVKVMSIHELLPVMTMSLGYEGVVNIRKLNKIMGINKVMAALNHKMTDDGLFIGCVETYQSRKRRHKEEYGIIYYTIEPLDFLIKRVFPRYKVTRRIQKLFRIKISRAISLTEALGRLVMNGFEIVDYKEINHIVWFVGKKVDKPKEAKQNYGLLFKKSCAGKNGKIIDVYKMRTMHPYSEYLQAYLIKNHGYSDAGHGKIRNDFRISRWGKFMRSTWIDEMPQFINVFRGEMNLVGVRPIRPARLDEFPEDLRELRKKFKPGCIPPYVSLLMGDEEGNIEAERIYLEEKIKSPYLTDIKYLIKGLYNMFTRKITSS